MRHNPPAGASPAHLQGSPHSADLWDMERLWELYRDLGDSLDLDAAAHIGAFLHRTAER